MPQARHQANRQDRPVQPGHISLGFLGASTLPRQPQRRRCQLHHRAGGHASTPYKRTGAASSLASVVYQQKLQHTLIDRIAS